MVDVDDDAVPEAADVAAPAVFAGAANSAKTVSITAVSLFIGFPLNHKPLGFSLIITQYVVVCQTFLHFLCVFFLLHTGLGWIRM